MNCMNNICGGGGGGNCLMLLLLLSCCGGCGTNNASTYANNNNCGGGGGCNCYPTPEPRDDSCCNPCYNPCNCCRPATPAPAQTGIAECLLWLYILGGCGLGQQAVQQQAPNCGCNCNCGCNHCC